MRESYIHIHTNVFYIHVYNVLYMHFVYIGLSKKKKKILVRQSTNYIISCKLIVEQFHLYLKSV